MAEAEILSGKLAKYRVVGEPLGSGAYAETVEATVVEIFDQIEWADRGGTSMGQGHPVIIKRPKADPQRGVMNNRDFIRDVNNQLETDFAALLKLKDVGCVARIFDHGEYDLHIDPENENEIVFARFLVEEYIKGTTLDQYLTNQFASDGEFVGIPSASEFYKLARNLAEHLQEIHRHQIIHGDVWYTNIMRRPDGELVFIDFGSAVLRDSIFLRTARRPADVHGFCAPERWEGEREGRRSDIYSLGGVFSYMATGEKPLAPDLNDDRLKRDITARILQQNPSLINDDIGAGVPDLIVRCMRHNKDSRIRDAGALICEIRTLSFDFAESARVLNQQAVATAVSGCVDGLCADRDEFFCGMFQLDLNILLSRAADMANGVFDLSGDHEDIVSGLTMYLSMLEEGDAFFTQSIPMLWLTENLGINGRFVSMNRMIAKRGVTVRHLFLLCDEDELDTTVKMILATHSDVMRGFEVADVAADNAELDQGGFRAFYRIVPSMTREQLRLNGWHRCFIIRKEKTTVIEPVYDGSKVLRTLRFLRRGGDATNCKNDFERELALSKLLPVAWKSD